MDGHSTVGGQRNRQTLRQTDFEADKHSVSCFRSDEGPLLKTLDLIFHILAVQQYFIFRTAYAARCVY